MCTKTKYRRHTIMPLNYYLVKGKQISSIFMHLYFNAKATGAYHYFFRFCKVAKVAQYKRHDNISFYT